jgi:hypothetical protein
VSPSASSRSGVGGAAVWVNLSLAWEFKAGSAALDPELLNQALSWVSAQA